MVKSLHVGLLVALALFAGFITGSARADTAKASDEVFTQKGLTKVGFWIMIPQEVDFHAAVNVIREAKKRLITEGLERGGLRRSLDTSSKAIDSMEVQLSQMREQLKSMPKSDPDSYNRVVDAHNALLANVKNEIEKEKDLRAQIEKVYDSSPAYDRAVAVAAQKMTATEAAYEKAAADPQLTALIANYNKTATTAAKLGPSTGFKADADMVRKLVAEIGASGIPLVPGRSVPVVEVSLNGGPVVQMVWDSGCTGISLSAKTAKLLELQPGRDDPTIDVIVADGRTVKRRVMKLHTVSVGPFTVQNVRCTIPVDLNANTDSSDLLGDGFQSHFLCHLDMNNGLLRLTPLAGQEGKVLTKPVAAPVQVAIDGPFKNVGLIKAGSVAVLPQEVEVRAAANLVRATKTKLHSEGMSRAGLERALQSVTDTILDLRVQLLKMRKEMDAAKDDGSVYNRLIAPHNAAMAQYKTLMDKAGELAARESKLEDSSPAYEAAVQQAALKIAAALPAYQKVQSDAQVKAALAKYNQTAQPPVQLGPSTGFQTDVQYITEASAGVAASAIPLLPDVRVPMVHVTLNGTVALDMVWDSGATVVTLSGATAKQLGLDPKESGRVIETTLADGKVIKCRIVTLKSITVGPYTAEKVVCTVPLDFDSDNSPNLLGGTFQSHFLGRLDLSAGVLRLTPLPTPESSPAHGAGK